ncbi:MAG TPA: hypothetical protein VIC71_02510 [Gammaproteobacteria bacterium]|jgi:hypothetical protein
MMIPAAAPPIARASKLGRLHAWVVNHDDSWLFIAPYIGLAVILSLMISLFWLIVVVAAHAALEWYVHWREHPSVVHTAGRVAWEIKLDLALILFALALAVYMDYVMGAAGLSAAARAGARGVQATGRMIAWQRGLRAVLLTLDDAAQVTRAAISSGQKAAAAAPAPEPPKHGWGGWVAPWTVGDCVSIGIGAVCLVALAVAPLMTGLGAPEIVAKLAAELHPWP